MEWNDVPKFVDVKARIFFNGQIELSSDAGHSAVEITAAQKILMNKLDVARSEGRQEIIDNIVAAITKFANQK